MLTLMGTRMCWTKSDRPDHSHANCLRYITAAIAFVCLVTIATAAIHYNKIYRHMIQCQQMEATLNSLRFHRPNNYSKPQWDYLLGWTINGYANCLRNYGSINATKFDSLIRDCELKVQQNKIDTAFIDWYWDQLEKTTTNGQSYALRYRPTDTSTLQSIEFETFGLGVE